MSSKARGRWRLLRSAILGNQQQDIAYSIRSHNGFCLLPCRSRKWYRRKVIKLLSKVEIASLCSLIEKTFKSGYDEVHCISYSASISCSVHLALEVVRLKLATIISVRTSFIVPSKIPQLDLILLHNEQQGCKTNLAEDEYKRFDYELPESCTWITLKVRCPKRFTLQELVSHNSEDRGIDNTGNVCVWPSEEILVFFCLKQKDMFRHKRICELGAGMTGFAGIVLGASIEAKEIVITDGNLTALDGIRSCIKENEKMGGLKCNIKAKRLIWNKEKAQLNSNLLGKFDIIIAADCLFFEDYHMDLLMTISCLLIPNGICFLLQPKRGNSLKNFKEKAKNLFHIEYLEDYDPLVYQMHQKFLGDSNYNPQLHYPVLLKLKHLVKTSV